MQKLTFRNSSQSYKPQPATEKSSQYIHTKYEFAIMVQVQHDMNNLQNH